MIPVVCLDQVRLSEIWTSRNLIFSTLHCGATDAEGCVLRPRSSEVDDHLLSLSYAMHQVVG